MEKKYPNRILYSQEVASMEYNPAVVEGFKEDKSLYEESFQEYLSKEEHDAIVKPLVEALKRYETAGFDVNGQMFSVGSVAREALENYKKQTGK